MLAVYALSLYFLFSVLRARKHKMDQIYPRKQKQHTEGMINGETRTEGPQPQLFVSLWILKVRAMCYVSKRLVMRIAKINGNYRWPSSENFSEKLIRD